MEGRTLLCVIAQQQSQEMRQMLMRTLVRAGAAGLATAIMMAAGVDVSDRPEQRLSGNAC